MRTLKRGNWSTHELERLRGLYPRSPEEAVARLLRRSVTSVQRKARQIFRAQTSVSRQPRPWTGEDDLRLREGFGVIGLPALALVLQRSESQVAERIECLRSQVVAGREWHRVDIGMLKKLYGSRSDADLAVSLGRTVEEIADQARSFCLCKDKGYLAKARVENRSMPRWGEADVALLRKLYPTTTNLDLAKRLQRSVASVANKANQIGLKKQLSVLREMGRRNVSSRYRATEGS